MSTEANHFKFLLYAWKNFEYPRLEIVLNKFLTSFPGSKKAGYTLYLKARLKRLQGRHYDALHNLDKVLTFRQLHKISRDEILFSKGKIYQELAKKGRLVQEIRRHNKKAVEIYEGILKKYPDSVLAIPVSLRALDIHWHKLNNYAKANAIILKLFKKVKFESRDYLVVRKWWQTLQHHLEIDRIEKISRTKTAFPLSRYYIARIYEENLQNYELAVKHYERFLKESVNARVSVPGGLLQKVYLNLADIYQEELFNPGKASELLLNFIRAYPEHPRNPRLLNRLSKIYEEDFEDFHSAIHMLERIKSEYPENAYWVKYAKTAIERLEELRRILKEEKKVEKKKRRKELTDEDKALQEESERIALESSRT
ncbi:tetratricopeptide repeat protein [Candidatus Riflebacteria bacterium]